MIEKQLYLNSNQSKLSISIHVPSSIPKPVYAPCTSPRLVQESTKNDKICHIYPPSTYIPVYVRQTENDLELREAFKMYLQKTHGIFHMYGFKCILCIYLCRREALTDCCEHEAWKFISNI